VETADLFHLTVWRNKGDINVKVLWKLGNVPTGDIALMTIGTAKGTGPFPRVLPKKLSLDPACPGRGGGESWTG
jgi:hypothetical protein